MDGSWRKLGLVFPFEKHRLRWMHNRATLPTPVLLDDVLRVFFTTRDDTGASRISFFDLDPDDPTRVLAVNETPLLAPGPPGTFDDSGTMCDSVVEVDGRLLMYYTGYSRRVLVPHSNAIGLAISTDAGRSFEKVGLGPVVDRTLNEPYFAVTAHVAHADGAFRMWYASGTGWVDVGGPQLEPIYVIKHAESSDGISWRQDNVTCIEPLEPEQANARPAVVRGEGGVYRMWFCYRGSRDFRGGVDAYRIGYAESDDGLIWRRDDASAGIEPGPAGSWDDEMQAYPAVIRVKDRLLMFYNGNGFGSAGIGCAVQEL
jgi:hypothetical protein